MNNTQFQTKSTHSCIIITLILALMLLALPMLSACQKANKAGENKSENAENRLEVNTEIKTASGEESESSRTEKAVEEEDDTEVSDDFTFEGNGHFFVSCGDKVYFHVPTALGMEEPALWGRYTQEYCGETALCEADIKSGETRVILTDESKGVMNISGTRLMFAGKKYINDEKVNAICQYSPAGEKDSAEINDLYFLGGDREGHYVAGEYYVPEDNEYEEAGTYLQVFKDGELLEPVYMQQGMDYIGIDGDELFYIYSIYNEDKDETEDYLAQLNLEKGDRTELGKLPTFEFCGGTPEQAEFADGKLYFSYANYQGSANCYCEGYFISAVIGEENSLEYEHDDGNIMENCSSPFLVKGGRMQACDGIPGSAKVIDDSIGYYDENGKFLEVSSKGYAFSEDDGEDGLRSEIELCEKLGDFIYAVRNISERAPDGDIGWRYAYRRLQSEVIRINIATGEEELLFIIERD